MKNPEIPHPDLVQEIAAFCEGHDMKPTAFGKQAVGDASLVSDLAEGRECRRATIARIRAFMREHSARGGEGGPMTANASAGAAQ